MAVAQQSSAAATANKPQPRVSQSFVWRGVNRRGQKVSGEMKGETLAQVKADLIRQGVVVQKISKHQESIVTRYTQTIKPMDIAVLTRQIATMLTAGVPLVQTLRLLASSHEKRPMREMLAAICADIETGTPPSKPYVSSRVILMISIVIWWPPVNSPARWMRYLIGLPSTGKKPRR